MNVTEQRNSFGSALKVLLDDGFAVASLGYRLAREAGWPVTALARVWRFCSAPWTRTCLSTSTTPGVKANIRLVVYGCGQAYRRIVEKQAADRPEWADQYGADVYGQWASIGLDHDVGMRFRWVAPGTQPLPGHLHFRNTTSDPWVTEVNTNAGFWLAETETTVAQWHAAIEDSPDHKYPSAMFAAVHAQSSDKEAPGAVPVYHTVPDLNGTYGLLGGVMEWTASPGHSMAYLTDDDGNRITIAYPIACGGAWSNMPHSLDPGHRMQHRHDNRQPDLGFRVVVSSHMGSDDWLDQVIKKFE